MARQPHHRRARPHPWGRSEGRARAHDRSRESGRGPGPFQAGLSLFQAPAGLKQWARAPFLFPGRSFAM